MAGLSHLNQAGEVTDLRLGGGAGNVSLSLRQGVPRRHRHPVGLEAEGGDKELVLTETRSPGLGWRNQLNLLVPAPASPNPRSAHSVIAEDRWLSAGRKTY